MAAGSRKRNARWLWWSAAVIALDQLSKYWLQQKLPLYERIPLLPHLNLTHLHNTGAAFSTMTHAPAWTFVLLSTGVSLGIIWWLSRNPASTLAAAGLASVVGGALGNAIDRVHLGYVVDFVDFYIGDWDFPAFNLADSAITLGAGLLILDSLLEWRTPKAASDA